MLDLLLDELKVVAKSRGIKGYRSMSKERLLSAFSKLKLIENNFDKERLKKIREDLNRSRHKFSKSKIKEIRKNLYEIENKKNLSTQDIEEIEKSFSKLKKYYDYDGTEYIGIRDVGNLSNQSTDKDYWVILNYATSHNEPHRTTTSHNELQRTKTSHNKSQPATTNHSELQRATTTHNEPEQTTIKT